MDFVRLGRRVLEARLKAGLTQTEFGKLCELSDSPISRIENGKTVRPVTVHAIHKGIIKASELDPQTVANGRAITPFGEEIDAYCKRHNLTSAQFAERVGVSTTTIRNTRYGIYVQTPETVAAIQAVLDADTEPEVDTTAATVDTDEITPESINGQPEPERQTLFHDPVEPAPSGGLLGRIEVLERNGLPNGVVERLNRIEKRLSKISTVLGI